MFSLSVVKKGENKMRITLNLDKDLINCLKKDFDPGGEWFSNLPVSVQLQKLKPFLKEQSKRDIRRFNMELAA
jgi:hypothetical protein